MYTNSYFPRVAVLADTASPSHKANWSGLEGIPCLLFQLVDLAETSLDKSPSHVLEREQHQLRLHSERFLQTQNLPTPIWYLLKEDSYSFLSLLNFSFLSQTGFQRLRHYDKSNLPTKWCFKRVNSGGIHPLCKLHLGCLPSQLILIIGAYERQ